jgi:hypothetical protein
LVVFASTSRPDFPKLGAALVTIRDLDRAEDSPGGSLALFSGLGQPPDSRISHREKERNPSMKTQMQNSIRSLFLLPLVLALVALAPAPNAFGVVPAPDGGYPGGNTAEGTNALFSLTTGVWNTALGFEALNHDTAGAKNTATGLRALFSNTSGSNNTANGVYALYGNTIGWYNDAVGAYALSHNTEGSYNAANGYGALYYNTEGNYNTATGFGALYRNVSGGGNTANGYGTLAANTGSNNTALGIFSGSGVTTANGVIAIGAAGANVSNSCFIGNIFGTTVSGGTAVFINSFGQLGTVSSSRRFKNQIKPMDKSSEAILGLKPVTFHYKSDSRDTPQFGLIAEEVAEINPDLVVRDEKGEIYTVRYDAVNAMLLNEFLKEHRKVEEQDRKIQEQEATIVQLRQDFQFKFAEQQRQIKALTSSLEKVNNRLELNRPLQQVVVSH